MVLGWYGVGRGQMEVRVVAITMVLGLHVEGRDTSDGRVQCLDMAICYSYGNFLCIDVGATPW